MVRGLTQGPCLERMRLSWYLVHSPFVHSPFSTDSWKKNTWDAKTPISKQHRNKQNHCDGLHKFFQSHRWFIGQDRFSSQGPAWPHLNYEVPCIEEILLLARSEKSKSACQALLRLRCISQHGTLKDIRPKSKGNTEGESQVTFRYGFRERMKQLVRNYLRNGFDIKRIHRSTH